MVWFQFSVFTQQLLARKLATSIIFSQEVQGRGKSSSWDFTVCGTLLMDTAKLPLPKSPKILHLYKVLFSAKFFKDFFLSLKIPDSNGHPQKI